MPNVALACTIVCNSIQFLLCRLYTSVSVEQRKLYALIMCALI